MTFRTRKNKTRVLIAFGKGIASALGLELAMLFCHAGIEVRTAFIDNGNEWLAESPIKQLTGHAVLSSQHQPAWFFGEQKFATTIIIGPSGLSQQHLCSGASNDQIIEFILKSSQTIQILQNRQLIPEADCYNPLTLYFSEIPSQPAQIPATFNKVFADFATRQANRNTLQKMAFTLTYSLPDELKSTFNDLPAWVYRLQQALLQAGLSRSTEADETANLVIEAYDGPLFVNKQICNHPQGSLNTNKDSFIVSFFGPQSNEAELKATDNHIFVKRLKNGLQLVDIHGTRLLPDVSGHCAFTRLAAYLTTNLQRLPQPGHTA